MANCKTLIKRKRKINEICFAREKKSGNDMKSTRE